MLGDGPGGDDRSRLELDEDGNKLPAPEPGALTPLGPNDGLDSIQLPVTVEPNVDLSDGDTVTATQRWVRPRRAGRHRPVRARGRRRGAASNGPASTAATSATVQYADADADGVAAGTFKVRRVLTTPATGTVDCALEAERCIVAMGAIGDYDRSGGFAITFTGGGEPIDIPTITASPAEGLSDGDLVHVEGDGFAPNAPVLLNICAIDPAGCWGTGEFIELDSEAVEDAGLGDEYGGGGGGGTRSPGCSPTARVESAPTCRCGGSSPARRPARTSTARSARAGCG